MGLHGGCDRQTGGCAAEGRLRRAAAEAPGRGEMGCGCLVVPGKGQEEHGRTVFGMSPGMGGLRSTLGWLPRGLAGLTRFHVHPVQPAVSLEQPLDLPRRGVILEVPTEHWPQIITHRRNLLLLLPSTTARLTNQP